MKDGKIQMVDLKNQYLKIKDEIDRAIQLVIDETSFINGSQVKLFSEQLANFHKAPKAVTCGCGTDALQIAMMTLGLKQYYSKQLPMECPGDCAG